MQGPSNRISRTDRWQGLIAAALLLVVGVQSSCFAEEPMSLDRTAKIKAAVVFQISKFLTLPEPIRVKSVVKFCLIGESRVSEELLTLAAGQEVNGQRIEIEIAPSEPQCAMLLPKCDLVFFEIGHQNINGCFGALRALRLPSICHLKAPQWNGCMAQVFREKNRARIAIDLEVAERIGVSVSSEILSLAVVHRAKL